MAWRHSNRTLNHIRRQERYPIQILGIRKRPRNVSSVDKWNGPQILCTSSWKHSSGHCQNCLITSDFTKCTKNQNCYCSLTFLSYSLTVIVTQFFKTTFTFIKILLLMHLMSTFSITTIYYSLGINNYPSLKWSLSQMVLS